MNTELHLAVIDNFLSYINTEPTSPYILKGGTALMKCYGLDRVSEDIDLDAPGRSTNREAFLSKVSTFCDQNNYSYRIGKNTDTVQRAFINYGDDSKPLKVELSYRQAEIPASVIASVDGLKIYTLDVLCQMKVAAYQSRDKMRDLYDVAYLATERFNDLGESSKTLLKIAFEYKDLSQLDYLLKTQDDALIDKNLLADRFLLAYDKVGLLTPSITPRHTPTPAPTPKDDFRTIQRSTEARNAVHGKPGVARKYQP